MNWKVLFLWNLFEAPQCLRAFQPELICSLLYSEKEMYQIHPGGEWCWYKILLINTFIHCFLLRVMNINPGARHPAELVVHVVSLIQEQFQHQSMIWPSHCHFSHLEGKAESKVTFFWIWWPYLLSKYSWIKGKTIPIFWMVEFVPKAIKQMYCSVFWRVVFTSHYYNLFPCRHTDK